MKFIYHCLTVLLIPFALLRLLLKSRTAPAYRQRLKERLALELPQCENPIWIHTVSVGEFLATLPLIEKLLQADKELLITTTTPTGSAMVREKLGNRVKHCYLPLDAQFLVTQFLNKIQPCTAVFVETEIWANYLAELKRRNIAALLINARLSEKSFNGYRKLGDFTRDTLQNFTEIACQNEVSCHRFTELGGNASTRGNLKFDLDKPQDMKEKKTKLNQTLNHRSFILVASTHKGEDEIIIEAYKNSQEKRLLVIAPRHPERSDGIMTLVQKKGLRCVQHTQIATLNTNDEVLIVDMLGQLLTFYALADYAIIGGSFVPHGGHNPLEPALFATPTAIGKHYSNFEPLINEMQKHEAIKILTPSELFSTEPSKAFGENAAEFLITNQGATESYCQLILAHTPTAPSAK